MKFARYTRLEPQATPTPAKTEAAFDWGSAGGAGMIELAAAILADCLGNQAAKRHAAAFAANVLRRLPEDRWKLDESAVRAAVQGDETELAEECDTKKTEEPHLATLAAWLASGQRPKPRRPHARVG
jgi:hypothetical protein